MIGIIGAMAIEMEKISSAIQNKTEKTVSGIRFISGTMGNTEVVAAVCGVGKVFAAVCTQTMILLYNPEMIINVGVAGGLDESLEIGDIAVATDVVQHDMDTSPLGDPVGMISGINLIKLPADEGYCEKIAKCVGEVGLHAVTGTIVSGDQFICDPIKKEYFRKTFGAVACEMEGAAVGHVCYINKVPFVVVRAISDTADGSAEIDFIKFTKTAAENSVRVIENFTAQL